jgi:uncharacterized membrane protein (UPF0127 family)
VVKKIGKIEIADSPLSRGLGLVGRADFRNYNGMLLKNTNAIHTFFVRFPIDVAFLNKDFKILKTVENLKPFSFSPIGWGAKHTLELPEGAIKKYSLEPGVRIEIN